MVAAPVPRFPPCAPRKAGRALSEASARRKNQRAQTSFADECPGALLGVHVSPASVQDRDGAKVLRCLYCLVFLCVTLIFADGGYQGKLEA